jgi:hypothetical protein
MKLRNLWIGEYRNLRDVSFTFLPGDELYGSTSIGFLVGVNGTGKSNALDAIGLIFSHLDAGIPPGLEFDIEYEIRDLVVRVTTRRGARGAELLAPIDAAVLVRPAGDPERSWRPSDARRDWGSSGELLPTRVIGHSEGPTSTLEAALVRSVEHVIRSQAGSDVELSPSREGPGDADAMTEHLRAIRQTEWDAFLNTPGLAFLDASDSALAALAALTHVEHRLSPSGKALSELLPAIGLDMTECLRAFAFTVPMDWQERLTGARRDRAERLVTHAASVRPIQPSEPVQGTATEDPAAFRLAFDLSSELRSAIRSIYPGGPLSFFDDILAASRRDALRDATLVLRKTSGRNVLPHTALSDGEYLYLTRYALLSLFLPVPDCLLLLDEPDTHFNDHWAMDLIRNMTILAGSRSGTPPRSGSEVLIATHSDTILTDADPRTVQWFTSPMEDAAQVVVTRGPIPTLAASRSELASRFFSVPAGIGTYAQTLIDTALEADDRTRIAALLELVGPGFARFRLEHRLSEPDRLGDQ